MKLGYRLFLWSVLSSSAAVHGWTPSPDAPNNFIKKNNGVTLQQDSPTALFYANNHEPSPYTGATNQPATLAGNRVGEVVMNGKYVLTGYIPVPSPKCEIYKAYPLSHGRVERHNPLIVKFSNTGVDHEYLNYQRLWSRLEPHQQNLFVQVYDRIPPATLSSGAIHRPSEDFWAASPITEDGSQPPQEEQPAGLVMERGKDNLRVHIRKRGAYRGDALRHAMRTVIQCVHALHSNSYVWTELKPENFVVTKNGESIKGIDLESLIPTHELLQVYTAEACPPEFPIDDMYQTLPVLHVEESFDMWGLGLVLFEMACGESFYSKDMTNLEYIQDCLRNIEATLTQEQEKLAGIDVQAATIILACLQPHPHHRPSCQQLLDHPYFAAAAEQQQHPQHPQQQAASLSRQRHQQQQQQQRSQHSQGRRPQSMTRPLFEKTQYNRSQQSQQQQQSSRTVYSATTTPHQRSPFAVPLPQQQEEETHYEDANNNAQVKDEDQQQLCWKSQLQTVLETLQECAQEDPSMASDLKSILDRAKAQLVRGSAHAAGTGFAG
jgi:serine/threonine protein kinase